MGVTTDPSSRSTTNSPTPSESRHTSPTRTPPGSAARTSTSTAGFANTFRKAPASRTSPKQNSTSSSPRSTTGRAKSSAGQPRPRSSKNYAPNRPQPHVALRTRTRDRYQRRLFRYDHRPRHLLYRHGIQQRVGPVASH